MRNFLKAGKVFYLRVGLLWKFRSLLRLLKKTTILGEKILLSPPVIWDETNPFSKIIIVFLATNIHRLRSIGILCAHGQAKDAIGLLRVMFEDSVDFKYMQNDKTKIQDFIEYDSLLRLKLGRAIERRGGVNPEDLIKTAARNVELKNEWNKVKHKFSYRDKNGKERVYPRWNGEGGVATVAKKVNAEESMDYIWHYFSNFMHTSTLMADHYILGRKGNSVVIQTGTSGDMIEPVARTAIAVFVDILGVIDDEYRTGYADELRELSDLNSKMKNSDEGF